MKLRNFFYVFFIICVIFLTTFILYNNKTYSYGILKQLKIENGQKTIKYIDTETNFEISFEDAKKYFGVPIYEELYDNGVVLYFKNGKEINHQEFIKGKDAENADEKALSYGVDAYRVHTTDEFIYALNDIYQNLKTGEFHIIFSKYEAIDFDRVNKYYNENYGVNHFKQNYYTYQIKGLWEPNRFGLNMTDAINNGELIINSSIRISGNERAVLEDFTNKLLPFLYGNGSDYDKILATYTYITKTATYLTDNGFINDLLASNTSAYDALISRKTTCIGYSIAFSYIMDKLGIESYIVDQVTEANENTNSFASVHTYNIVKLNNKFYKADLTGNIFLGGISASELYDSNLNISNTSYSANKTINIDYNSINNLLNESKSLKTTTTKKAYATTTIKNYPYSLPGNKTKTTQEKNNNTTNKNEISTSIITTTDSSGNTITVPIVVDKNGETITDKSGNYIESPSKIETNKKKNINYNYILFPILILGIITLIVLRIKSKKKRRI